MWKESDDKILNSIEYLNSFAERFPNICPICQKKDLHIFLFKYNEVSSMGGIWIWCSECKSTMHSIYAIPKYWKNLKSISIKNLSSNFDYLENRKEEIDNYINNIKKLNI